MLARDFALTGQNKFEFVAYTYLGRLEHRDNKPKRKRSSLCIKGQRRYNTKRQGRLKGQLKSRYLKIKTEHN